MNGIPLFQQMGTHSRDWGNRSGAGIGYALAPAEKQDVHHPVSVGGSVSVQSGAARLHDVVSLLNWPSAVATVARPLSRSIPVTLRSLPVERHRRQVLGLPPPARGPVATLCRCRLARGPQCCLLKHGACKLVNASKGHNQNVLSTSQFQRPNRDIERIVNVQQVVGEIRNV